MPLVGPLPVWPSLVIVALPALDVPVKFVVPKDSLLIVALPALEVSEKFVVPIVRPPLLIVALPALDVLLNVMVPNEFEIVCVVPEVFTIPAPTMESALPSVVIV